MTNWFADREICKGKKVIGFPIINKVLLGVVAAAGVYLLAVGCRIIPFTVMTGIFVLFVPFLFTVRVSKRKAVTKKRTGMLHKILAVGIFIGLCIVLYDFLLYANLLTQIQFRFNGYVTIYDSKIKDDMTGLLLLSKGDSGESIVTFLCEGWKFIK